jgi:hypothetical protein
LICWVPWYSPLASPSPILVEQRELAARLQHALDHEHDIRPARVVFIEAQGDRSLDRPGEQAFAEFGDLVIVAHDDGITAHQIDAADVAVEIDAHQRPVQPRRHLLDVRGFSGAMVALHHDAAVEGEAGEDGERRVGVETIARIDLRDILAARLESRHQHIVGHAEGARRDFGVGRRSPQFIGAAHGGLAAGPRCIQADLVCV